MPAITTPRDRLRLEIGDTDISRPLFTDDELDTFLTERTDRILLAAADACDVLATRFAKDYDFGWRDQQTFNRSQMSKQYADRAKELRARAAVEAEPGGAVPLYSFPDACPLIF